MKHLIIRNLGPIKSVDIKLNKVNVFIGPQGSGKSTIAKIISFCNWLEKVNEGTEAAVADGLRIQLEKFYHMRGFFNEKTQILFEGQNIAIVYNWKSETLPIAKRYLDGQTEHLNNDDYVFYTTDKTENPKVIYIPAERNFVSAVPNLSKYAEKDDVLQSFINDWFEAKRHYPEDKPFNVVNLGFKYYFNAGRNRDELLLEDKTPIALTDAASGFQSIVPLALMVRWLSSGIYEENQPFSPEEVQKVRNILAHVSGSTSESESQVIERLRGFIQGKIYSHTQFIIEEPEQNLFPKTQMDLLYDLISEINHGRNHRLVMTTHSPYLLYALNNCMLAFLVKDKVDKEVADEIECLPYALNPHDVSVWSLKDGYLRNAKGEVHKTIQDERGLIRKNYFNDVMHQVMGDFNKLLEYDD